MTPENLESLLEGARETDAIEFKAATDWNKKLFVKDILALANVIDGGVIIVGVADKTFERQGLTPDQIASFDIDIMRDQIEPYADPRVIFHVDFVSDAIGNTYAVIDVSPFEDVPVICAKDGEDVNAGTLYFRSRSRRPESARIKRSVDMREVIETAIVRRSRALRRAGFLEDRSETYDFEGELGGL